MDDNFGFSRYLLFTIYIIANNYKKIKEHFVKKIFDDSDLQAHIRKFTSKIKPTMSQTMSLALDRIGQRAQADYWRKRGGRPLKTKLTARSTRLIRSLSPQGGSRPGGMGASEQIRIIRVTGNQVLGIFGSRVDYAQIHETGGSFVHPNLFGRGIQAVINMPARPYLSPALNKEKKHFPKMFANRFWKAWK